MNPVAMRKTDRGFSLIEAMVALSVLVVGILALARLFPTASREQVRDRMETSASFYAQERLESLRGLSATHADLAEGRHPSGGTSETVGPRASLQRYWTISYPPSPLENIARVDVVVFWSGPRGPDSVFATTYLNH